MEWLKHLLPVVEAGLKFYLSGQLIKKSAQNAKAVAIRSGIIAFGFISFFIFFAASILMLFIDLGHQFETHAGVHFSGMMLSGIYLVSFGILIFGICFAISKIIENRERRKKAVSEVNPYHVLIQYSEELLKVLIKQLNSNQRNE